MGCYYFNQYYGNLVKKFKSSESISRNYSAALQDMFVLTMLNGKRNGFFLEIGAEDAVSENNTYLLEKYYDWNGISIDIKSSSSESFEEHKRSSYFILSDALIIDYKKLFSERNLDKQIDYLSLDIDPATQTLDCLKKLPLDDYRFSVITYETDFYNKSYGIEKAEEVKQESREILTSYGYELVIGNVFEFEDWYVDPRVVDRELIDSMKRSSEYNHHPINYLLGR